MKECDFAILLSYAAMEPSSFHSLRLELFFKMHEPAAVGWVWLKCESAGVVPLRPVRREVAREDACLKLLVGVFFRCKKKPGM